MTGADPRLQAIAAELGLDAETVAERLRFLEFTDEDERLLRELHTQFERRRESDFFVDAFYAHLRAFPATRALLADDATVARLKRTQATYFDRLTAGDYGVDYMLDRLRIGLAHERVGLAPQWYIGAYNKYLALLAPRIRALYPDDPERALDSLAALLKMVFFDMGLAIDSYIHAANAKTRTRAAQLKSLNDAAVLVGSSLSPDDVIDQVLQHGMRLAGVSDAAVTLYDEAAARFGPVHAAGLPESFREKMQFRPGGLADQTFRSGQAAVSSDRPGSAHPLSELARTEGLRALICLPLISRARRLGVLYFYRRDRDDFQSDEIEVLMTFAHFSAGALDNAELHARTAALAATDALTGLFNRRVFDVRLAEEVQRTRRFGQFFSLLLLDIDHFKRINDRHGHMFGDQVLRRLADVLRAQMREVDVVARFGGEEFVVVLPGTDATGAQQMAERLRASIAATDFAFGEQAPVPVTVSVGTASFPEDAASGADLLAHADVALYQAKANGRNRVCRYRGPVAGGV